MMKLADTVEGMNSADYKKRFIAEYQQLRHSKNILKVKMLKS
ncbi:hypothetical protein QUW58_23060 [Enterocloster aldenensis]|nr:hypothetical protein [Enterocloster aldenensis]